jgi:hypothetical protein
MSWHALFRIGTNGPPAKRATDQNAVLKKRMSRSLAVLSVAVPILGIACSTTSPVVRIAEPVGPAPSSASVSGAGQLVVHTPASRDRDTSPDEYPPTSRTGPSQYTIFDTEGHQIQTVNNQSIGAQPEIVNLADGDYLVRAKGRDNQVFEVKVRLERGKTTHVFLDGSRPPAGFGPTDQVVRTSDGMVVGWRAIAIGGGPPEK